MTKSHISDLDVTSHDGSTLGLTLGGTLVTATAAELNKSAGVTAGTVTASKAVVVDSNKDIATLRNVTMNGTLTFSAGGSINTDSGTGTCSSNAVTISKMAGVITTESLSTAAAGSQAITLTNTLIAAGDLVILTKAGGTNTRRNFHVEAVAGSGSATITIYNTEPTNALDGTIILNFLVLKA